MMFLVMTFKCPDERESVMKNGYDLYFYPLKVTYIQFMILFKLCLYYLKTALVFFVTVTVHILFPNRVN